MRTSAAIAQTPNPFPRRTVPTTSSLLGPHLTCLLVCGARLRLRCVQMLNSVPRGLCFHQSLGTRWQTQNAYEASRVFLVVAVAHREARDVHAIQRVLGRAADDIDIALVERE